MIQYLPLHILSMIMEFLKEFQDQLSLCSTTRNLYSNLVFEGRGKDHFLSLFCQSGRDISALLHYCQVRDRRRPLSKRPDICRKVMALAIYQNRGVEELIDQGFLPMPLSMSIQLSKDDYYWGGLLRASCLVSDSACPENSVILALLSKTSIESSLIRLIDIIAAHDHLQWDRILTAALTLDRFTQFIASYCPNEIILNLMVKHGSVSALEQFLMRTRKKNKMEISSSPRVWDWAIEREEGDQIVAVLLQDGRIDPRIDETNVAFCKAATRDFFSIVLCFLQDSRIDPSIPDNDAISGAAMNGNLEIVELLLGDKRVDPTTNNNYPIRAAAEGGHLQVVARLMRDPRVDPSDNYNEAWEFAMENGFHDIAALLLTDERVEVKMMEM